MVPESFANQHHILGKKVTSYNLILKDEHQCPGKDEVALTQLHKVQAISNHHSNTLNSHTRVKK